MTHLEEILTQQQTAAAAAANAQQLANVAAGMLPATPRLRMNRTAALVLSPTWQRIDFNGTSPGGFNVNLFPYVSGTSGPRRVEWDATNKLFKFTAADQNYGFLLDFTFTGGLRPADIFYRFVIPVPGAPIYFPAPEGVKQGHLLSIERLTSSVTATLPRYPVYVTAAMQQYGLGIELASTTALLTHPTLTEVVLILSA